MQTVKAASLILDYNLYPRAQVDALHVKEMCDADKAGVEFPPVVADHESKRVTDGFHRITKQLRLHGEGAEIQCNFKKYKSEREMFMDAMHMNAHHGRNLCAFDKAHCIAKALDFGIPDDAIAGSLAVTVERIELIRTTKMASIKGADVKLTMPIKNTIRHKAGKTLTVRQQETNVKLGGMNQVFYVNQLIMLIESDLLDKENDKLMERLGHLKGILP